MEIEKEDLLTFLKHWIKTKKIDLDVEQIFDLIDLVNDCFNDTMMYDSWFKGINVMD